MPGMPSDKIVLVSGSLKDCTLGSKDAYCELANADLHYEHEKQFDRFLTANFSNFLLLLCCVSRTSQSPSEKADPTRLRKASMVEHLVEGPWP
jgi:hypothetical protein